jgi:hypothetical protein
VVATFPLLGHNGRGESQKDLNNNTLLSSGIVGGFARGGVQCLGLGFYASANTKKIVDL